MAVFLFGGSRSILDDHLLGVSMRNDQIFSGIRRVKLALFAVAAGSAVTVAPLRADVITVCLDGSCDFADIQSATFLAANGDIIDIGPGTYSLPSSVAASIPIVNPYGKALRFRGAVDASGQPITVLDGMNFRRAVQCNGQETSGTVFENLTIRGCPDSAVYISGSSSPTLINCTITGNVGRGAGIAFANHSTGNSKVINCRITGNNSGSTSGGGVYVEGGSREFIDCTISQNRNSNTGAGVMVSGYSHVKFVNCTISNNTVSGTPPFVNPEGGGAGLHLGGDSAFLQNCSIVGNAASVSASEGGGVEIYFSDAEFRNCLISQNSAVKGGGIFVWGSSNDVVLTACRIQNNNGSGFGGGIYVLSSVQSLQATYSNLCGNVAPYGAQIYGNGWPPGGANCVSNACSACPLRCLGDLNGDSVVDGGDLGALLSAWGSSGAGQVGADANGDGVVDGNDLGLLLGAWGPCPQ
jgi:parallel beta-helix repeat protein